MKAVPTDVWPSSMVNVPRSTSRRPVPLMVAAIATKPIAERIIPAIDSAVTKGRSGSNPRLRRSSPRAMQHLAAGVVFAAAAAEILPQVMHEGSPIATFIGGTLGVVVMLSLKALEGRTKGPVAMLGAIGIDILIDGLVLGLAFVAGAKAGLLLTIALTLEVLFLGLTVTAELGETVRSRRKVIAITIGLALLLPVGALVATSVAMFPPVVIAGFLSLA